MLSLYNYAWESESILDQVFSGLYVIDRSHEYLTEAYWSLADYSYFLWYVLFGKKGESQLDQAQNKCRNLFIYFYGF